MDVYLKDWYNSFLEELPRTRELRVISPFVKEQVIRNIQSRFEFGNFQLITRFNLGDFASKVSSLESLKFSVECGANVFGVRNLHSKVYLFDNRAAIVTSANLTMGGLVNNFECGIYTTDSTAITRLHDYFNELKEIAGQSLSIVQCEQWQAELDHISYADIQRPILPDYGGSNTRIDYNRNYYVKFFGSTQGRVPLTHSVKDEIERALCHYACGFSAKRKPKQINDGDVIYMARMTNDPSDFTIFGKAEAIKYLDGRDRASEVEIEERPWKEKWPIYLRVENPIFINGTLGDCVLLYDLIRALQYKSFASTKERYEEGERDINPYRSLSQQPYIKLTFEAVEWLQPKFQEALNRLGRVPQDFIESLPQPNPSLVL